MPIQPIPHAYTEVSDATGSTHTGDINYTPVANATIASSNFVVGRKYLIVVDCILTMNSAGSGAIIGFRVLHGSTIFPVSERLLNPISFPDAKPYRFFVVWTAVSGESINCEFKVQGSGNIVTANHIGMLALEISEAFKENTDWFYSEDNVTLPLTQTFQDGASVSFTPDEDSDWLVLSECRVIDALAIFFGDEDIPESRIKSSGDFNDVVPIITYPARKRFDRLPIEQITLTPGRVYPLTPKLNTFTEQARNFQRVQGNRVQSSIFAINMNKFSAHVFKRDGTTFAIGTASYGTLISSIIMTPVETNDVWFGVASINDSPDALPSNKYRTQLDQVDDPPSQSVTNYLDRSYFKDPHNIPFNRLKVKSISAPVTFDVDGDSNQTTTNHIESSIWAIQLTFTIPPEIINSQKILSTSSKHEVTSEGD